MKFRKKTLETNWCPRIRLYDVNYEINYLKINSHKSSQLESDGRHSRLNKTSNNFTVKVCGCIGYSEQCLVAVNFTTSIPRAAGWRERQSLCG
jgi:hypothetical protein